MEYLCDEQRYLLFVTTNDNEMKEHQRLMRSRRYGDDRNETSRVTIQTYRHTVDHDVLNVWEIGTRVFLFRRMKGCFKLFVRIFKND